MNDTVLACAATADGGMVAGGNFTTANSQPANHVARWTGTAWLPLGSGTDGSVYAVAVLPNGDVVVGGQFTSAGGTAANNIARWDGTSWSPLGAGTSGHVRALLALPDGSVIAAGSFTSPGSAIARWDGTAWAPLGAGLPYVGLALARMANGDIVASSFFNPGHAATLADLRRWNGTSWTVLPWGQGWVNAMAGLPNGDLVVGGAFNLAAGGVGDYVARLHGGTWTSLGASQFVNALVALPNGDIIAGGAIGTAANGFFDNIGRWNGTTWLPLSTGLNDQPFAMAMLRNGELGVVGRFTSAGGSVTARFARLRSSCPASAQPFGTACSGVGGNMVLTATELPWLGGTYRSESTGFGPNTFGVWEIGTGTLTVPVQALIAAGGPGCVQNTTFDVVADIVFPVGGVAEGHSFVPLAASLIGAQVFNQMALVEVDPATFGIVNVATSNGLTVTVGAF